MTKTYVPNVKLEFYTEENELSSSVLDKSLSTDETNILSDDIDTTSFNYEECNIMNMIN